MARRYNSEQSKRTVFTQQEFTLTEFILWGKRMINKRYRMSMVRAEKAEKVVRHYVWGWGGGDSIYVRELTWNLMFEQRPKGSDTAESY